MPSQEAMQLLKRIQSAFPEAYSVTFDHPGLNELREADYVDLYDMGPRGEARWTVTAEGRAALALG